MTTEAVMIALRHAGWSVGERSTAAGHVAEAERGGHRVAVAARSPEVAWLALWAKLTGPRRFVVSDRPRV
jgi:hypothetical protein